MNVGVGVEGPSDKAFWDKVLHKHFRGVRFDVRSMKNRDKLIRSAPELITQFKDLQYDRCLFVLDRDSDPCPTAVIERFEPGVVAEARGPVATRFASVAVAIKELEAWYLADAEAIHAVLPDATYHAEPNTDVIGAEGRLRALWREQHGTAALNKIDFAKSIAPKFQPDRARSRSPSFSYFWDRLNALLT